MSLGTRLVCSISIVVYQVRVVIFCLKENLCGNFGLLSTCVCAVNACFPSILNPGIKMFGTLSLNDGLYKK